MPFELFRPLLLSFLKRPFRSREATQPARRRKQNGEFRGKRAPEKSTCGGCEERQTKPRAEKPRNRCRRGQARLPYYLDKGLFPSWGNRRQTASSQRGFAPQQMRPPRPRCPCPHESQPDLPPREKPGASPRHGFSRARVRPRQTRRIPCLNAPTLAITATTPLSATITSPRPSTYGARTRCPRLAWQRRCTEAPSPQSSRRRDRENLRSPAKTGRQGQSASR